MKIPQVLPFINESEVREITRVVRSTFITQGKATRSFEEKFQKLTKTKFAIAVFNATVGLYSALKALDIGPGDEIIVPDLTFIATANAVIMAGARPIFCDIDRKTFNLHPGFIEKFINKNTKAIMPVHLYGQPADMDEIMKIAKKHKLFVIEDAAESVGARFRGKYVGTFGDIGVFSFYANKIMTTAEGGLILTNNPLLAKKCLALRNHGRIATGTFIHPYIGFNFKFTDLQAAIGLAQFKKLPKMNAKKQKILDWYRYFLKDVKDISFPYVDPRCSCVIWFINILCSKAPQLSCFLTKKNIETRSFFPPLHVQPCYDATLTCGNFSNSDWVYKHGLSLPSSVLLKKEEVRYVCQSIRDFFSHER